MPKLLQYAEVLSFSANDEIMEVMRATNSSGSARGGLHFSPKIKEPMNPTVITGSASNLVVKQPLVSPDIAAPTGVILDNRSPTSCRVRLDVSGDPMTKDNGRVVATGDFEILVSVE